ncbi:DNA-binding CsgD family transcriptional regulator [Kibdelosporangium banguiense]|uniref:DNA-binding CsgD family transcriptional regulator n=1 Tax=Kibdelosporangium banguiense TaxID=1365924 RepID=A0ABS4U1N9_9PSEU|nr:helix-turn-helix domain-containing protein [Kibdelosporangium banguiense]MBP2330562.1 DNA-binding CsgD family transcriptional regulator [Kibdelosporangium banguiense]
MTTELDRAVGTPSQQALTAVPRELAERMRPHLGQMVRDMIVEIQRAVPAYRQPLEGKFGEMLVGGVQTAIEECYDTIGTSPSCRSDWLKFFRYTGKVEFLQGRTMDALQTAVRIGGRVAWRHLSTEGRALGIEPDTLFAAADAIFAYVDELSAVAVEGYTEAQARAGGARERRRQQLLKMILAKPQASRESIAELAAMTGWTLPDQLAVIALEYREDQHQLPATALGPQVLVDLESAEPCLVVAEPELHLSRLASELRGRRAAIGPAAPLENARHSLRCARTALTLVQRRALPQQPITWCRDHLSTLLLLSDEFLAGRLVRRALSPFADLTEKQRDRLMSTLHVWLGSGGGINEIANRLGIHPQTVRYRIHQLTELLGDRLNDPAERLNLEIALRTRQLLYRRQPTKTGPNTA